MPEYSGSTPFSKKLGIKDGFRVRLFDMPANVRAELKESPADCQILRGGKGQADFMMLCANVREDLEDVDHLVRQLTPAGMLWISWPKKSSGVAIDLTENIIREIGLAAGLVDVKVCAVTEVCSGLKFVRRLKDR